MDDIIIIANDETEALERLERVLKLAASYNLQIEWKKCEFLKRKIIFLGSEIENKTIRPRIEKTKDVHKYPEPKTMKQLKRFHGFANYFRKFIDNYAFIAKPLTDLKKKNSEFKFNTEHKHAFEQLKSAIISKPVLAIYDPRAESQLHTDASKFATAAILMQRNKNDNEFHPVHFLSKRTTENEEK